MFAEVAEDMGKRESMIFYASWWDAVAELPSNIRQEVVCAAIEYGLCGTTTSELGQISKAMFGLIKPQVDANNVKYENGCKGGVYGGLGGRPKKPQENPEKTPNENENVNVNENEKESERKRALARTHEEEVFNHFISWCKVYAADSLRFTEPLTLEGFVWLCSKYGAEKMKQCASDIHNKGAYRTNKNALNCWKRWIAKL